MTEVGAVLVGGGELHDRWSTLCRTSAPLQRGIQRFTGITQAMVDSAPSLEDVLPPLAERLAGRILVAHNAPFDRRVLRQAFDRIGLDWPNPPVICTAAVARTAAAAAAQARARRARGRARDRGRARAPRAGGRGDVRAGAVRAVPAAVRQRDHGRRRAGAAGARPAPSARAGSAEVGPLGRLGSGGGRGAAQRRPRGVDDAAGIGPEFGELPSDPGVYLFRDGARQDPLCRQVGVDPQPGPRALRPVLAAGGVDGAGAGRRLPHDGSELGALILESRLIAELKPPGNKRLTSARRPARLHPLPAGHRVPDPRCRARPRRRSRGLDRARPRPAAGAGAGRAAGLAVRPAPLRPAAAAPRVSVRLRADGTLPVTVSGRPGSEPLPTAAGPGAAAVRRRRARPGTRPGQALLDHLDDEMRRASVERRYERAQALHRRAGRLRAILGRLDGVLEVHARAAAAGAGAPSVHDPALEGFWLAGGRLVDSGVIADGEDLAARCAAAARARRARGRARGARAARRDRAGQDPADVAGVASGHGDADA